MRRNLGRPNRGLRACCVAGLLVATLPAFAQDAAPPPPRVSGPESGFIGALGRFIERSIVPAAPRDAAPAETAEVVPEERLVEPSPVVAAPAPGGPIAAPPQGPAAKPVDPLELPRGIAKGAIDAVTRLPATVGLPQVGLPSSMVTGRERCVVAANGAPDCLAATEALCKSKGFVAGNSLDIQSAQRCKAHVWLSGRTSEPNECTTESFVTRAVCR
jgi:hypothetical protein